MPEIINPRKIEIQGGMGKKKLKIGCFSKYWRQHQQVFKCVIIREVIQMKLGTSKNQRSVVDIITFEEF